MRNLYDEVTYQVAALFRADVMAKPTLRVNDILIGRLLKIEKRREGIKAVYAVCHQREVRHSNQV